MIIVLAEEQQPYSAMVVLYVFSMDSKIWGLALCWAMVVTMLTQMEDNRRGERRWW